jgi:2-keto-myo-inositol isomerase
MKPALAQICTLDAPLEQDVEDYAAGKCEAIEIWVGKLDTYLDHHSPAELRELLARHGVVAPVASFQGGLFGRSSERATEHWAAFERRLVVCRELAVRTLVLAGDIQGPLDDELLQATQATLAKAADLAARNDVRLAFEFQGRAALANNLETATALVEEVGHTHLGLCLDVFQYYIGPSKTEDLAYLTAENLFHVQLSDLSGVPRELATDSDRILPGDGDFQLEPIVGRLRQIGYEGYVSVELMNPQIWRIAPRPFGEIAMTALRKVLGLASME